MRPMLRAPYASRASRVVLGIVLAALAAACASSGVAPTGETSSAPAVESSEAVASASQESVGESARPSPAGPSQQDEICLAVLPAADVGAALGSEIDGVIGLGDDASVSLTCTYTTTSGGTLLVTTAAGDAAAAYQSSLDLATGYEQDPVILDGPGDQAFYAKAADRWPEQVVFATGPLLVRLVNQTSTTIGEAAFAALATTAADSIPSP
jgi:hypothetical protein